MHKKRGRQQAEDKHSPWPPRPRCINEPCGAQKLLGPEAGWQGESRCGVKAELHSLNKSLLLISPDLENAVVVNSSPNLTGPLWVGDALYSSVVHRVCPTPGQSLQVSPGRASSGSERDTGTETRTPHPLPRAARGTRAFGRGARSPRTQHSKREGRASRAREPAPG